MNSTVNSTVTPASAYQPLRLLPGACHITYALQYRTCGKRCCNVCRGGPGHGPYWYAYYRTEYRAGDPHASRLRSVYLGKTPPKDLNTEDRQRAEAGAERHRQRHSPTETSTGTARTVPTFPHEETPV